MTTVTWHGAHLQSQENSVGASGPIDEATDVGSGYRCQRATLEKTIARAENTEALTDMHAKAPDRYQRQSSARCSCG